MKFKSIKHTLLIGLMLCTAGITTVKASSTIVTFSVDMATNIVLGNFIPGTDQVSVQGAFNGWTDFVLVQQGSSTVYTNTYNDTTDANGGRLDYRFRDSNASYHNGGYEDQPYTGQNRDALLPSVSGASLVLPTPYFGDDGAAVTNNVTFQVNVAEQVALGNFTPSTGTVEIRGNFNGFTGGVNVLTNDPSILVTNTYGVTSNVYVGTFPIVTSPAAPEAFKYVLQPGTLWDSPSSVNQEGGGNRYFANVNQTLPLVDFSDQPYSPIVNIAFNVDMTYVALTDPGFNPATVALRGSFNGWGSLAMTNNPTAPNTNIYTAVVTTGIGSTIDYKFFYNNGSDIYENPLSTGGNNRSVIAPSLAGANTNLPTVLFNDAGPNDLFLQPTPVLFSVDMSGAVGTDGHVFDPNTDGLYINGQFAGWYAWAGGVNPVPTPSQYQMIREGTSMVYTNTIILPAGPWLSFQYKYGMDIGGQNFQGPTDNEAAGGNNHFRVVRATAFNPYAMPTDKFGIMYSEPYFSGTSPGGANLTIGAVSGGTVPVMWLGRPGAHLQSATGLTGPWTDYPNTDGTNWTSGYSSTNGFVSQTNWPAGSKAFFRLVKP
jgi:hypothetical protein